ncbi:MAG: mechanosensitive ion channel [Chitinophagaceae bacterium]|nr:mechanosensitive ion channel [Chitinophagaceae bacterium]
MPWRPLFSGIFPVLNKPFKIDDIIEFQGSKGRVVEISLNATILSDKVKIYKRPL